MRERLATGLLVASILISAYIAWQVTNMPREQLSGQYVTSQSVEGSITTERFLDESLEEWRVRHDAAVRAAGGLAKR